MKYYTLVQVEIYLKEWRRFGLEVERVLIKIRIYGAMNGKNMGVAFMLTMID